MEYIGEHSLIGQLGHFFVLLSFVAAILATVGYFFAARNEIEDPSWKRIGRIGYVIHGVGVAGIISCMFVMLINHYYEYDYVWKHSSNIMPMRYILSCFWEGQEGSFLLWTFWHVVIGLLLMRSAKKWEAPVMTIFSVVQVFLASMLLGLYFGEYRLGNNPFLLIRELPDNIGLPWTDLPNYLQQIPSFTDGRGLNPLLQNYWMTIHPPTLFLGFASTLVPFAYAIAGLWKGQLREWIAPALPWTFFSVMVLGIGILMGGAWAYEALSFGGFWAWDPVENASLVPWLTLVGAAHVMVISKNRGTSLFLSAFLPLITFILVLYSTFLTRSGILGDSSVHSFTGDGMLLQLLIYLLFFVWLAVGMLLQNRILFFLFSSLSAVLLIAGLGLEGEWINTITILGFVVGAIVFLIYSFGKYWPKAKQDDELWSRDFWMFVGSIVLVLSAIQVISQTSLPVVNLLFGTDYAPLTEQAERIQYYNKFQIGFAILITFLIGVTQFLKYKKTNFNAFLKNISLSFIASIAVTALFAWSAGYSTSEWHYILLLFTGTFAVVANLDYYLRFLKGKLSQAGAPIAHIGFGFILLGALVSTSKSDKISESSFDLKQLSEDFKNHESILLFENDTIQMGDYFVSYHGKRKDGIQLFYKVDYFEKAGESYKKEMLSLLAT